MLRQRNQHVQKSTGRGKTESGSPLGKLNKGSSLGSRAQGMESNG